MLILAIVLSIGAALSTCGKKITILFVQVGPCSAWKYWLCIEMFNHKCTWNTEIVRDECRWDRDQWRFHSDAHRDDKHECADKWHKRPSLYAHSEQRARHNHVRQDELQRRLSRRLLQRRTSGQARPVCQFRRRELLHRLQVPVPDLPGDSASGELHSPNRMPLRRRQLDRLGQIHHHENLYESLDYFGCFY